LKAGKQPALTEKTFFDCITDFAKQSANVQQANLVLESQSLAEFLAGLGEHKWHQVLAQEGKQNLLVNRLHVVGGAARCRLGLLVVSLLSLLALVEYFALLKKLNAAEQINSPHCKHLQHNCREKQVFKFTPSTLFFFLRDSLQLSLRPSLCKLCERTHNFLTDVFDLEPDILPQSLDGLLKNSDLQQTVLLVLNL
jgi:hypothetical protein